MPTFGTSSGHRRHIGTFGGCGCRFSKGGKALTSLDMFGQLRLCRRKFKQLLVRPGFLEVKYSGIDMNRYESMAIDALRVTVALQILLIFYMSAATAHGSMDKT